LGSRFRKRRRAWLATGLLCVAAAAGAATPAPRLDIGFRLSPEFAGAERVQGTIVVTVTNAGDRPLRDVTLRMAEADVGRLTGSVNEGIDLDPRESRTLQGHFQFDAVSFDAARPLAWHVLYRDEAGFVLQTRVIGSPRESQPVQARNRD
jgi:hypothetical protein